MIPGRYPTGIIKKEEETKKETNQSKTFQNMKTPTYIRMHYYVFLKCPPFTKEKFQPCPPTTL
jgi:hypothetical protein